MTRPPRVRPLVILTAAALIGAVGLMHWPFPDRPDVLLVLWRHEPHVVTVLRWTYVGLWFTTPALVLASLSALTFIFVRRTGPAPCSPPCRLIPSPVSARKSSWCSGR